MPEHTADAPLGVAPLSSQQQDAASERPWLYGFLIAPSGAIMNGLIQGGALAALFHQQGVSIARSGALISLLAWPTSLYFLWSPITDFFVKRRTWLLIGSIASALLAMVALMQPHLDSHFALTLIFLSGAAGQLVVSSCGGMMGAMQSERAKRLAGSFYQGGSLCFGALAMKSLLDVSSSHPHWLGYTAAAMTALPALFVFLAPRQAEVSHETLDATFTRIGAEVKSTFLRWEAIPYILCMTLPIATGAGVSLLPGVADRYGVSQNAVGWINGLGGGLLMAAGSLSASLVPAKLRATVAYMFLSLLNCAALSILWLGPLRPSTYYMGVAAYVFTVGACYAMFTAVVLEFLGTSGKSGSGRYSVINSLGNIPVLYMLAVDGWGAGRWGPRALAGTECVPTAVASAALLVYFLLHPRRKKEDGVLPGPTAL